MLSKKMPSSKFRINSQETQRRTKILFFTAKQTNKKAIIMIIVIIIKANHT